MIHWRLPERVGLVAHLLVVLVGTALLTGPQSLREVLDLEPYALGALVPHGLGSLWCVAGVGVLLVLWQLLRNLPLLLVFVGLSAASVAVPWMSLVLVGIAGWLVVTQIAYLVQHGRIVVSGFVFYGIAWLLDVHWPWLQGLFYDHGGVYARSLGDHGLVLLASVPVAVALDRGLRRAYDAGYQPVQVAVVALTAPAVVLLLVLAVAGFVADVRPDLVPGLAPDLGPAPGLPDRGPDVVPIAFARGGDLPLDAPSPVDGPLHLAEVPTVLHPVRGADLGVHAPRDGLPLDGPQTGAPPEGPLQAGASQGPVADAHATAIRSDVPRSDVPRSAAAGPLAARRSRLR